MDFKKKVQSILISYSTEIVENYNQTALMINSCEKAATYYHSRSSKLQLDTTTNIPGEFKFKFDLGISYGSTVYKKKDLIEQYEKKLHFKLVKDYLVTTVTTFDSMMEDLYEQVLIEQEKDKTEEQIKKLLRWGDIYLPSDLITRLPILQSHANLKGYKLEDFLYTYEYLRQIRHATVHSKGKLQQRHLNKMMSLEDKMNEKQKISVNQLHNGEDVLFTGYTIYMLRHWCLTFINFVIVAFNKATSTYNSSESTA